MVAWAAPGLRPVSAGTAVRQLWEPSTGSSDDVNCWPGDLGNRSKEVRPMLIRKTCSSLDWGKVRKRGIN